MAGEVGIDHILVVVRYFLVQPLRRMREKVAMLVHRAALNRDIGPQHSQRRIQPRGAVDDDEFRRLQATFDKIVEEHSPGCLAFAAHILDRQQYLLAIFPHAQRHEKRNRRGLLVEPHAHDRAVENEPDDRLILQ